MACPPGGVGLRHAVIALGGTDWICRRHTAGAGSSTGPAAGFAATRPRTATTTDQPFGQWRDRLPQALGFHLGAIGFAERYAEDSDSDLGLPHRLWMERLTDIGSDPLHIWIRSAHVVASERAVGRDEFNPGLPRGVTDQRIQ